MKRSSWVWEVSRRWFSPRRGSGGSGSSMLAAAGIAVGVAALIVILGIMNGFQLGYIESILEISSYHVRVDEEANPGVSGATELEREIRAEPGVRSVVPLAETQVLVSASGGRMLPMKLRILPADIAARDPPFMRALGFPQPASVDFSGLVVGSELARFLNVASGDQVDIVSMTSSREEGLVTKSARVPVGLVYHSGYYDFDSGLGFITFEDFHRFFPDVGGMPRTLGIKLADANRDAAFVARAEAMGLKGVEGWRDYNRSFFGALRTEKTLMMLLVGLIFAVVGVNIFQSMRRNVFERSEEIALLRALGGESREIRRAFVADGIVIGAAGAAAGLLAGLFIATNVNGIFSLVASALNSVSALAARLWGGAQGDFSVYSPRYFYLMEVPVRLLFPEIVFVVAAAVGSTAAAAAGAASHVAGLEPAELLRYE